MMSLAGFKLCKCLEHRVLKVLDVYSTLPVKLGDLVMSIQIPFKSYTRK